MFNDRRLNSNILAGVLRSFAIILIQITVLFSLSLFSGCGTEHQEEIPESVTQNISTLPVAENYTGSLRFILCVQPYGYKTIVDSKEISDLLSKVIQIQSDAWIETQPTAPGGLFSINGTVNEIHVSIYHTHSEGQQFLVVNDSHYSVSQADLDELLVFYNESSAEAKEWKW